MNDKFIISEALNKDIYDNALEIFKKYQILGREACEKMGSEHFNNDMKAFENLSIALKFIVTTMVMDFFIKSYPEDTRLEACKMLHMQIIEIMKMK